MSQILSQFVSPFFLTGHKKENLGYEALPMFHDHMLNHRWIEYLLNNYLGTLR